MSEQEKPFESWCIVELFGHNKIAGLVTEQPIGGASFVRIDVPAVNGMAAFTKLYGPSAIYGITPTTEEIATLVAENIRMRPVSLYIVPISKQLPGPGDDHDNDPEI